MTALLFIPATAAGGTARRLDFARLAGRFAEREEPARQAGTKRHLLRVAAAVLLLLVAIGDTMLVVRPGMLAGAAVPRPTRVAVMS